MDENKTPPVAPGSDKGQNPQNSGGSGQGNKAPEAPYNLPEKFKGKSPDEIAQAYVELEKKLGEQSSTIEEANRLKEQTSTLISAIYADPDTYKVVEQSIKRYASGEAIPERKKHQKTKGDEAPKAEKVDPIVSDLRTNEENRVLNEFFTKYGYTTLDEKTRKDAYAKIATTLAEIVDPGGKRPLKDIMSSIPVAKLGRYLENAHFIANKDSILRQAKDSAVISQSENESGAIGSFASSSKSREPSVTLTNQEREVARKMGISEEKYVKRKAQILKDSE